MELCYYKGRIIDYSNSEEKDDDSYGMEIHLYSHEGKQYIVIDIDDYVDYEFEFCKDCVYHHDRRCTYIQLAYCEVLEIYMNNHIDELHKFDKATLDDFADLIERTYTPFMESCESMKKIFEGGKSFLAGMITKSAK